MTDFWTITQITKLRELYQTHTVAEIAVKIDKDAGSVASMAKRLRLRRRRNWLEIARNHKPTVFAVRIGG